MVFALRAWGNFSETIDQNIETKNLSEFNVKFEAYREKKNLTAQDVITIGNLAKDYNNQSNSTEVTVTVSNVESKYRNAHQLEEKLIYEFIEQYSYNSATKEVIYFECQSMEYNETTGKVSKIVIKKL